MGFRVDVGAPDKIRTCDLCLRRAALYPAELRVRPPRDSTTGCDGPRGAGRAPHPPASRMSVRRPGHPAARPRRGVLTKNSQAPLYFAIMTTDSRYFCIRPFTHLQMEPNGEVKICCIATDVVRDGDRRMNLQVDSLDEI